MEWPQPNERLFRSGDIWQLNACINCHRPSLSAAARAYREGAETLAKATAEGDATLDCAILPIAFLYRQFLELIIKDIIDTGRRLEGQGKGYPTHHNLKDLWAEALGLLRKQYGPNNPPELAYVQPCIDEFTLHDEKSMAFRYPTDKEGKPYLRDIDHINLGNLYETMDRIGNLLDCLSADLNHRWEVTCEMAAENPPDFY
jgi:hypothetical protein